MVILHRFYPKKKLGQHFLKDIKINHNYRTILCFVIQRTDISSFQPSNIDIYYKKAVQEAVANGVELMTIVCKWNYNGDVNFITEDWTLGGGSNELESTSVIFLTSKNVWIKTDKIPLKDQSVDFVFLLSAAHEIRAFKEKLV